MALFRGKMTRFTLCSYFWSVGFILSLSMTQLGCQSLVESVVEKPKIKFSAISIQAPTREGATAVVSIDVMNPNSVALVIDDVDFEFLLGGVLVTKSAVGKKTRLEPKAESRVEIPIPFLYNQIFTSVLDLFQKGRATYKITGEARVGLLKIPFDHSGDVKIR